MEVPITFLPNSSSKDAGAAGFAGCKRKEGSETGRRLSVGELRSKKYDTGADMWAFGVMLYLMLFGRYPFEGGKASVIAVSDSL